MTTTNRIGQMLTSRMFWLSVLAGFAAWIAIMVATPNGGTSHANQYQPICSGANAPAQCWIPGLGSYLREKDRICSQPVNLRNASWTLCMVEGGKMDAAARKCLIAAGVTTGGVVIGGVIGGSAARAIAGGIVGGSGAACIGSLVT